MLRATGAPGPGQPRPQAGGAAPRSSLTCKPARCRSAAWYHRAPCPGEIGVCPQHHWRSTATCEITPASRYALGNNAIYLSATTQRWTGPNWTGHFSIQNRHPPSSAPCTRGGPEVRARAQTALHTYTNRDRQHLLVQRCQVMRAEQRCGQAASPSMPAVQAGLYRQHGTVFRLGTLHQFTQQTCKPCRVRAWGILRMGSPCAHAGPLSGNPAALHQSAHAFEQLLAQGMGWRLAGVHTCVGCNLWWHWGPEVHRLEPTPQAPAGMVHAAVPCGADLTQALQEPPTCRSRV